MVTYIFVTVRLLITTDLFMRRDVFQAIADPTRREIIGMLAQQSLNLNNVADQFSISRPAISRHIKILTECGLVTITQQGRERFCHADFGKLKQVADWTARYQKFWTEKLDALGAFLEQEKLQANDNQ
jgi:Predicted transcriptional regulators